MSNKNFLGAALCLALFAGSFALTGDALVYLNLAAFLVVTAGLLAAMLLSYPYDRIKNAFLVAWNAYSKPAPSQEETLAELLDLAVKSRVEGACGLERASKDASSAFLRNGLDYLADNYKENEVRECLRAEMSFFQHRRLQSARLLQTMARIAPAFGVAGSVIGLVGLLMGIHETSALLRHIPVAFISTLYGVLLANLVFSPMAEAVQAKTEAELLNQKLVMEGLIAIMREQNPYRLERKLTAFLSPQERQGKTEAVRAITRKYIAKKRKEQTEKDQALRESPMEA
ncbi:MAG: motility protein A [Desulfovibrionaceae bacterium]